MDVNCLPLYECVYVGLYILGIGTHIIWKTTNGSVDREIVLVTRRVKITTRKKEVIITKVFNVSHYNSSGY